MGLQGYLATITSAAEQTFIQSSFPFMVGFGATGNAWLGGSDAAVEGEWRWLDGPEGGQLFTCTNWLPGHPVNAPGFEDFDLLALHLNVQGSPAVFGWTSQTPQSGAFGYVVEYGLTPNDPGGPVDPNPVPEPSGALMAATALLLAGQQRCRRQAAHARSGQLQRQRQALQALHQCSHGLGIAGVQLEVGPAGSGALDEQPHGRVAGQLGPGCAWCRQGQRRHQAQHTAVGGHQRPGVGQAAAPLQRGAQRAQRLAQPRQAGHAVGVGPQQGRQFLAPMIAPRAQGQSRQQQHGGAAVQPGQATLAVIDGEAAKQAQAPGG